MDFDDELAQAIERRLSMSKPQRPDFDMLSLQGYSYKHFFHPVVDCARVCWRLWQYISHFFLKFRKGCKVFSLPAKGARHFDVSW